LPVIDRQLVTGVFVASWVVNSLGCCGPPLVSGRGRSPNSAMDRIVHSSAWGDSPRCSVSRPSCPFLVAIPRRLPNSSKMARDLRYQSSASSAPEHQASQETNKLSLPGLVTEDQIVTGLLLGVDELIQRDRTVHDVGPRQSSPVLEALQILPSLGDQSNSDPVKRWMLPAILLNSPATWSNVHSV